MSGVDDEKVIDLAASERRLLLTEDKDFGQHAGDATAPGEALKLWAACSWGGVLFRLLPPMSGLLPG